MKKKPYEAFGNMAIAITRSAKDQRGMLRCVYVGQDEIAVTNAKVLAIIKREAVPDAPAPGLYQPVANGCGRARKIDYLAAPDQSHYELYPKYQRVIPSAYATDDPVATFDSTATEIAVETYLLQNAISRISKGKELLYNDQLDMLAGCGMAFDVYHSPNLPVVFSTHDDVLRVVMLPRYPKDSRLTAQFEVAPVEVAAEEVIAAEPVAQVEPMDHPKAPEPQPEATTAPRSPARFAYVCTLESGESITLDTVKQVESRNDVVKCEIRPVKKRKTRAA